MSLVSRISDLATAIAAEINAVRAEEAAKPTVWVIDEGDPDPSAEGDVVIVLGA